LLIWKILFIANIFIKIIAQYPSSSKNPKNWDKINKQIEEEEKDEKLEGDAALNK
jgi:L-asparaginase/Glu-tRNA(Gln) amidotransferase subunit D